MSKLKVQDILEALVSELVKTETSESKAKKNRPYNERAGGSRKLIPMALMAELRFKPLVGELVWFAKKNRPWVGGRLLMVDTSNTRAPALVLKVGNRPNPDADPEGSLEVRVPIKGTRFEDRAEHYERLAEGVSKDIKGLEQTIKGLTDPELKARAERALQKKIHRREEYLSLRYPVH